MKTTQKNTFKRIVYVVFMALLITSCERDDTEFTDSSQTETKGFTVKSVTLNEVKGNTLIKKSLDLIDSQFDFNKFNTTMASKNQGTYSRATSADPITSNDNSFTILTDEILEVSTDTTKVYTFRIETPTKPESHFENFVIHKKSNDSIEYYIYRYQKIGLGLKDLNMSKEQVSSDQINASDFDDYTQSKMFYDYANNCWISVSVVNGILIIDASDCFIASSGDGSGTGSGFSFGPWAITGVTENDICIISRALLDAYGNVRYDQDGDPMYQTAFVDCPDSGTSSSDLDQDNPWGNSNTDPNYDPLHNSSGGGGSSSGNANGDDPLENIIIAVLPSRLDREPDAFFHNLTDEQKECLNPNSGQAHYSTVKDITAYFENNQATGGTGYDGPVINPQATTLATAAIDAMCNGVGENFQEALDIVISLIIEDEIVDANLDDCSKGILGELKTLQSTDIAEVIKRFGDLNAPYDWEIKTETPTNPNHAAETNWVLDSNGQGTPYDYLTVIDPTYKNQATKIAVARTILHEAIHAYILSYVDDVIENNTDSTIINNFQDNFPAVWNFYVAQENGVAVGNIEDAHHEQMAASFIEIIGDALAEYDNNQQDSTYYEHLAWGALYNTDAWISAQGPGGYIDFNEAEAIVIANNQEDTNGAAANGSPCP